MVTETALRVGSRVLVPWFRLMKPARVVAVWEGTAYVKVCLDEWLPPPDLDPSDERYGELPQSILVNTADVPLEVVEP